MNSPDKDKEGSEGIDEQLLPYLKSGSQTVSQEHLNRLLEQARPIVYRIARSAKASARSIGPFNTQDIFSEVCLKLLQSLRAFKDDPRRCPISNFSGLVATTTSTVFADFVRDKDRQRRSLYQKIRRLIAANSELATWKDDDGNLVCGYEQWRTTSTDVAHVPVQMKLDFDQSIFSEAQQRNTAEIMLVVLKNTGRPVRFDQFVDLVQIAAAGVQVQTVSVDDKHFVQSNPLLSYEPDLAGTVDNQRVLSRLMSEIGKLRPEQRKSLLLNMTDSYGFGIEWFVFTKIATEEHLARLLEVSIEQFRKMLNDLPMSDAEIAKELGVSESKVANIRRAVRERLDRRRRAFDRPAGSVRLK